MVFKPTEYKDKIGIYAGINFSEEQKKSVKGLKDDFKKKLKLKILNDITMMNLTVNFDSNDININIIHFQEHIYFNGLSKD
ncbi:MAG TPA: DUF2299 family protein [Nitrososphaeraceae archaeon]|nr:DUF2299 family protein [Nitrososphaeraceae archaeon]